MLLQRSAFHCATPPLSHLPALDKASCRLPFAKYVQYLHSVSVSKSSDSQSKLKLKLKLKLMLTSTEAATETATAMTSSSVVLHAIFALCPAQMSSV